MNQEKIKQELTAIKPRIGWMLLLVVSLMNAVSGSAQVRTTSHIEIIPIQVPKPKCISPLSGEWNQESDECSDLNDPSLTETGLDSIQFLNSQFQIGNAFWETFAGKNLRVPPTYQMRLAFDGEKPSRLNASLRSVPASTLKTVVAFAALKHYGRDFQFESVFSGSRSADGKTLYYPKWEVSGDPTWGVAEFKETFSSRFTNLAKTLRSYGIQKIIGPITVVSTASELTDLPFPRSWKLPDRWPIDWRFEPYGIVNEPFNIGMNMSDLYINSAGKPVWKMAGVPVPVVSTVKSGSKTNIVLSAEFDSRNLPVRYFIKGTISADGLNENGERYVRTLPVYNRHQWLPELTKIYLKQYGIRFADLPSDFQLPAGTMDFRISMKSKPLATVLKKAMQESINLTMDRLAFGIGLDRVSDYFKNLSGDFDSIAMEDGCGLSPENFVEPSATLRFLDRARFDLVFDDFRESFARPGKPGTLSGRLTADSVLKSRLYGKTGSIQGISNLLGYVKTDLDTGEIQPILVFGENLLIDPTTGDRKAASSTYVDGIIYEFAKQNLKY